VGPAQLRARASGSPGSSSISGVRAEAPASPVQPARRNGVRKCKSGADTKAARRYLCFSRSAPRSPTPGAPPPDLGRRQGGLFWEAGWARGSMLEELAIALTIAATNPPEVSGIRNCRLASQRRGGNCRPDATMPVHTLV